jgi:hypothetical protein
MEAAGFGLAVVGLLVAFKGAVDSYLMIEQLVRSDAGLQDRALHFERIRKQLEQWGAEYNVNNSGPDEDCLVNYESKENKEMILQILERTNQHLDEAKRLFKKHTNEEADKKHWWKGRHFKRKDGTKNQASWVFKDQEQVDAIIKQLNEHLQNLLQCTKLVYNLKIDVWKGNIKNLTSVDETRSNTEARNARLEGTCQWIFQRKEYKEWVSGAKNNLLWIHATRKFTASACGTDSDFVA